ncbi:hypothetical protein XENOCAPTIV_001337 [Xenoophorus captivus]|uniref:Uncharacterized protein n=1 Tax=Xenoophorus captivus TaxID=1517983 RepID=A0ABV0SCZ8_9TELE
MGPTLQLGRSPEGWRRPHFGMNQNVLQVVVSPESRYDPQRGQPSTATLEPCKVLFQNPGQFQVIGGESSQEGEQGALPLLHSLGLRQAL